MEYEVNGRKIHYQARGEKSFGDSRILLKQAVDLTLKTGWHDTGFTVQPLFSGMAYEAFRVNVKRLLYDLWKKAGLNLPHPFEPDQYHRLALTQEIHLRAVEQTKLLKASHFPIDIHLLEERISAICGETLEVRNPWDDQRIFHFRVIRPQSGDNNPLHRDVWLEDYANCINLYIPVAGSNELSSLVILPGSHLWPESRVERTLAGAQIGSSTYNVPAVTAISGDYTVARPSPAENEVLVFSPYLIHGGAVNLNTDVTRISIEVRLWRK